MMKKYFCLLITVMLLMAGLNGLAETPAGNGTFDYSVFEDKEGFSVDKFDKTWMMRTTAIGEKESVALLPAVQGNSDGTLQLALIAVVDENLNPPEKVQFLIDETVYSFDLSPMKDSTNAAGIMLTKEKVEFFEIFASAEEISMRINCGSTTSEDTFSGESLRESQEFIRELLRQDAVSCYSADGKQVVQFAEEHHLQDMEVR